MLLTARFAIIAVAVTIVSACSSQTETAVPVATPSVSVSSSDAAIGSPLDFSYRFVVASDAPAFTEEYWVFVHFLDADGELMWTDDHAPPKPTTQWKPGETIEYSRTMFVPKFPYVGEARVEVGLFSRASGDRLPLAGESAGQRAYVVARFNMRLQSENVFVVFRDGWYEAESGEPGSGLEWQWSRKNATLSFRNPKREAVLFLDVDQPVDVLGGPQQVEVRVGSTVVDSFSLTSGRRDLRRITVTPTQFGDGDMVDVTLSIDRTFVPAAVPAMRSADPRELGVRVFRAYVQPL